MGYHIICIQNGSILFIPFAHESLDHSNEYFQISGSMVALGSSVSSVFDKSPAINIPARITENKTYSQSFGALNVEGKFMIPFEVWYIISQGY